MYNIIRLIIGCIFLACSITVVRKSKTVRKHMWYVAFICLSLFVTVALTFLPFENLFITFRSPQKAYDYFKLGKSNIELIIEGDDCDFVVNSQRDTATYLIIPKTAYGWKVGIGSDTKRIVQKTSDGIIVYVYRYKSTEDYFITIFDTNGGESIISDAYNTKFLSLERYNNFLEKNFVTYYAHIPDFDQQYCVIVNGKEIILKNQ